MNGAAALLATLTVVAAAVALVFVTRGGVLGDRTEAAAGPPLSTVTPATAQAEPLAAAPATPPGQPPARGARAAHATAAELPAVTVLRRWDQRRARAYADGSAGALRALYRPGSDAGRADVRLLRDYRGRGYRVLGMRMQLLAVDVLAHRPGFWRLRITDRLVGAVAVGHGQRVELPRDQASTRVLSLLRDHGSWRVGDVR